MVTALTDNEKASLANIILPEILKSGDKEKIKAEISSLIAQRRSKTNLLRSSSSFSLINSGSNRINGASPILKNGSKLGLDLQEHEDSIFSSLISHATKLLENKKDLEKFYDFFNKEKNPDVINIANSPDEVENFLSVFQGTKASSERRVEFLERISADQSSNEFVGILREYGRAAPVMMRDFLSAPNRNFENLLLRQIKMNPKILIAEGIGNEPMIYSIAAFMADYSDEFIEGFLEKIGGTDFKKLQHNNCTVFEAFLNNKLYSSKERTAKIVDLFVEHNFELFEGESTRLPVEKIEKYKDLLFSSDPVSQRAREANLPLAYAKNMLLKNGKDDVLANLIFDQLKNDREKFFDKKEALNFVYEIYRQDKKLFLDFFESRKETLKGIFFPEAAQRLKENFDSDFAIFALEFALEGRSNNTISSITDKIPQEKCREVFIRGNIFHFAVENSSGNVAYLLNKLKEKVLEQSEIKEILKVRKNGLTCLEVAIPKHQNENVHLFIKNGAPINELGEKGTPLMQAAQQHSFPILKNLLDEIKKEIRAEISNKEEAKRKLLEVINTKNSDGKTALHYAAQNGRETMINALIEDGCDVSLQDNEGNTAAHLSAKKGSKFTTDILIKKNQEVSEIKNHEGKTVGDIISLEINQDLDPKTFALKEGETALHYAVRHCASQATFKKIFDDAPNKFALATKQNAEGLNPLHLACVLGSTSTLENLLKAAKEAFASKESAHLSEDFENFIHSNSSKNKTPLRYLASHGRERMLDSLCNIGGNVNLGLQDFRGNGALFYAIRSGATNTFEKIFRRMIDAKINCETENIAGQTFLHYAAMQGDSSLFADVLNRVLQVVEEKKESTNGIVKALLSEKLLKEMVRDGRDEIIKIISGNIDVKSHPELMMVAASKNYQETVKVLFNLGLDDLSKLDLPVAKDQYCDKIFRDLFLAGCKFNEAQIIEKEKFYPELAKAWREKEVETQSKKVKEVKSESEEVAQKVKKFLENFRKFESFFSQDQGYLLKIVNGFGIEMNRVHQGAEDFLEKINDKTNSEIFKIKSDFALNQKLEEVKENDIYKAMIFLSDVELNEQQIGKIEARMNKFSDNKKLSDEKRAENFLQVLQKAFEETLKPKAEVSSSKVEAIKKNQHQSRKTQ